MKDSGQNPPAKIPAVVCLAAGPSQLVVIDKARQLGYAVIAVDRDPQAPGFANCEARILASTYQAEPIISSLGPLLATYQVVGVVNRSAGLPVVTAAEICQFLRLPSTAPTLAATIVDKSLLMAACRSAGIAAPQYQAVATGDQIDHSQIAYPCVVKPAISLVGKSGITVVNQAADLPGAVTAALGASQNGRINIEEFLPGGDVSLTALVERKAIHPIVFKDELTRVLPTGAIRFDGVAVPSIFNGQAEEAGILQLARQVVDEFQLDRTVLNLSCRCEPGGQPKLIEIHLDLGGDGFYESLVPASTSADILGLVIGFLAGRSPELPDLEFKPAALVFDPAAAQKPGRPHTIVQAASREDLSQQIARRLSS